MTRTQATVATTTIFNLLATFFVILRVISRFIILKASYVDDYLIILGLTLSWSLTGLTFAQAHFGLGQHQDEVSSEDFQNQLLFFYLYIPMYNVTLTVVKLSALFQFLRFFVMPKPRAAAWVLISVVAMYGIAVPVACVCSCLPIPSFWIVDLPGKCVDLEILWFFNSSFNVVTDIAVVVLPLYVLRDLHLPRRQKWAVLGVFAVGVLTCITSVLRLHSVYILVMADDSPYNNAPPAMWSSIEVNTAIICACMQSLKPLVQKVRPKWLTQTGSSDASDSNTSTRKLAYVGRAANPDTELDDAHAWQSDEPFPGYQFS